MCLLCLAPFSLKAYDFEKTGLYYNFVSGTTDQVAVTYDDVSYKYYTGDIVVPDTVVWNDKTYKVTKIGMDAFYWCEELTSVVLPNTIQTIESWAFCGSSLPTITLPESVTQIENYVFLNSKLTDINVAANNPTFTSVNGILYNKDITKLLAYPSGRTETTIAIANSVTTIGANVFYNITNLISIVLPKSVTTIGASAFYNCSSLTTVDLSDSVTTIGEEAFANCIKLASINIPNSVTTIGSAAFSYCNNLTSINLPNSVITIGSATFYNCSSLASIILPNSITTIGDGTFSGCSSLTSITIPESVTTIGNAAFYGCKFSSVKIPLSVTSISGNSFGGIFFTTVEVDNNNPNFSVVDGILYNKDKTTLILYPTGKKESALVVPNLVDSIGDYAFYYCSNIASITLPETVKNIGSETFWYCSNLASINMPQSLTTIGSWAFESCRNFKEITFPDSLKTIGYAAFEMCGFSTITIPASVETIGSWAFTKCPYLDTIIFCGPVKSMGGVIFADWGFVPRKYDLVVKCPPFSVPAYFSSDFDLDKSTLTVPAGTKSLFESTPVWQDFKNIIESFPTGIPNIQPELKVFVSGNTLYLDTPVQETVSIYSLTGNLLYSTVKSAGESQITLEDIHSNIGIVKGSSGWVRKVLF